MLLLRDGGADNVSPLWSPIGPAIWCPPATTPYRSPRKIYVGERGTSPICR
ncbi:hypothetical protein PENFLA_c035G05155 [Penicillium flavigenum]|uniref:Uncharacterized protein n=1 Tax=Penicillium flavigenum TaxID=254877 RepID=A0A1V6SMC4_9EURO|nr:hypothetical protein PENFLA_c035G05155 [Penicillium flavigenum]